MRLAMSEDQPVRITFKPPAAYLDMARSMIEELEILPYDGINEWSPEFENIRQNSEFAVMSVTIVFSYQAVEAEYNGQLYRIYSQRDTSTNRYRRLIEKCGEVSSFWDIKKRTLGDKVKLLCFCLGIKPPSEVDRKNWIRFKQITEVMRHYIIHPDPERFREKGLKMMQGNRAGTYVKVAQNIIRHFYTESGSDIPGWVDNPMYFKCRGFELLPPEQKNP